MGKGYLDLTPEQRAAAAERARLLKSPRRQADQERMRLIGEKVGLNRLRKAETASPRSQEPTTPQRKVRKPGGGRPPTFTPEQRDWLREKYSNDLKADPLLKKHDAAVAHIQNLAKTEYDVDVGRKTLLEQIIRPVLRA
jgi:hypothetical protein